MPVITKQSESTLPQKSKEEGEGKKKVIFLELCK